MAREFYVWRYGGRTSKTRSYGQHRASCYLLGCAEGHGKAMSKLEELRSWLLSEERASLRAQLAEQTKAANHWMEEANKEHNDNERLRRVKGCQCICHDFPAHGKLQDALEANRFHAEKVADLERQLAAQVVVSQKLWAELTPEKRHEINRAEDTTEVK